MSRALASARARRANVTTTDPMSNNQQNTSLSGNSSTTQTGLTLPQVIALVDTRLVTLEKFMKDTQVSQTDMVQRSVRVENNEAGNPLEEDSFDTPLVEVLEDFNNRFTVLANEIAELKDIVIKLQGYTMDVNKVLMEDRVRILSDLGQNNDSLFVMKGVTQDMSADSLSNGSVTDVNDSNIRFSFSEPVE